MICPECQKAFDHRASSHQGPECDACAEARMLSVAIDGGAEDKGPPAPERYGYSYDGERYFGHCDSREAALAEATSTRPAYADFVWTCRCVDAIVTLRACELMIAENLCEFIDESVLEEHFHEDPIPELSAAQMAALGKLIVDWLEPHVAHATYTADDVEQHTVAAGGDE